MRLRTVVGTFTVVGTLFALLVSATLIWLTTVMHQTTVTIADGAESVHLAEAAQTQLLLHRRATDPFVRNQIERQLRRLVRDAHAHAQSPGALATLNEAEEAIDVLVRDPGSDHAVTAAVEVRAFRALTRMVEENLSQARAANARAARLDDIAMVLGFGGGAIVFLVSIAVLWWVRARAFEPVLALGDAMKRFGRGDTEVRAPEAGPGEVRDMAVRFNEMADAIAAQRHAQSAFLGGVAHDLRNPLQTLRLAAGVVAEDAPDIGARLERPIARLERMIGDFLDASKIEAGQLSLELQTHDARASMKHVVSLFQEASPKHTVHLDFPPDPILVRADPLRLEQVLTNLVSNAIKYSPDGGRVELSLRRVGPSAIFEVTDEGVGISFEDQRHLFEPFRRVGLSKETIPGVGLGLFVVRRIIEGHGGRIEVSSAPGQGSTFRVLLPAIAEPRQVTAPAGALPQLRNA